MWTPCLQATAHTLCSEIANNSCQGDKFPADTLHRVDLPLTQNLPAACLVSLAAGQSVPTSRQEAQTRLNSSGQPPVHRGWEKPSWRETAATDESDWEGTETPTLLRGLHSSSLSASVPPSPAPLELICPEAIASSSHPTSTFPRHTCAQNS